MTLTLTLIDPPEAAAPTGPVLLEPRLVAPLARALNTVVYGYVDDRVDGSPDTCEDLWLTGIAPATLSLALLHLSGSGDPDARAIAAAVAPILAYVTGEQLSLDLVRAGADGPELRLTEDDDGPADPRAWTHRRMRAALALAGLGQDTPLTAPAIAAAVPRIREACIDSRAARDVERLGTFAETLILWNDEPVLVYRALPRVQEGLDLKDLVR